MNPGGLTFELTRDNLAQVRLDVALASIEMQSGHKVGTLDNVRAGEFVGMVAKIQDALTLYAMQGQMTEFEGPALIYATIQGATRSHYQTDGYSGPFTELTFEKGIFSLLRVSQERSRLLARHQGMFYKPTFWIELDQTSFSMSMLRPIAGYIDVFACRANFDQKKNTVTLVIETIE